MDDRVEAIALGARWVRNLMTDGRQALRDFRVWIGLGTTLTAGMVLTALLLPVGIAAFTCAMVMMLGTLSWLAQPRRPTRFPLGALLGLSVALLLIEAPVLLLLADGGGPFIGMLLMFASAVVGAIVPPRGVWAVFLAIPAFLCSAFALGACFAPHLIATRKLNVAQAIHGSLLGWFRNPVAFLVFVGLGVALAAFQIIAMWIAAFILFPAPGLAIVLGIALWAVAALFYAAALVGFGRRTFGTVGPTVGD